MIKRLSSARTNHFGYRSLYLPRLCLRLLSFLFIFWAVQLVPPFWQFAFAQASDNANSIAQYSYDANLPLTEQCGAVILDNHQAGFEKTGPGWQTWSGGFQNNNFFYTEGSGNFSGTETATWTLSNVPAGKYTASMTWPQNWGKPVDVKIFVNGSEKLASVIDLQQYPNDYYLFGAGWEIIGQITVPADALLSIVLYNNPNKGVGSSYGRFYADAVRLQRAEVFAMLSESASPRAPVGNCTIPPESCPVRQANVVYGGGISQFINTRSEQLPGLQNKLGESCLKQALVIAEQHCSTIAEWNSNDDWPEIHDNFSKCVAQSFMRPWIFPEERRHSLGCFDNDYSWSKPVYYDLECNALCSEQEREGLEICYVSDLIYDTPISLIWDASVGAERLISLSSLPLDPHQPDKIYSWRGSDAWPLLVFDPAGKGEIINAAQLFGPWSFGGKREFEKLASLDLNNPTWGQPWQNGFEALAVLDRDQDAKLEGEELNGLSLWFDANRDGVSQAGEVKTLAELGVTSLLVTGYIEDAAEKTLTIKNGFERQFGSKTISGDMVDWWVPGSESPEKLLSLLSLAEKESGSPSKQRLDAFDSLSFEEQPDIAGSNLPLDLSGVWSWQAEIPGRTGDPAGGLLVFDIDESGKLKGRSLVDLPVSKPFGILGGVLGNSELTGWVYLDDDNKVNMDFSSSSNDKERGTSKVVLSRSQTRLIGKTTQIISDGEQSEKRLTYSWTAERYPLNKRL